MWFSRYFKKTKVGLFGPIEEYAVFLWQHTGEKPNSGDFLILSLFFRIKFTREEMFTET